MGAAGPACRGRRVGRPWGDRGGRGGAGEEMSAPGPYGDGALGVRWGRALPGHARMKLPGVGSLARGGAE